MNVLMFQKHHSPLTGRHSRRGSRRVRARASGVLSVFSRLGAGAPLVPCARGADGPVLFPPAPSKKTVKQIILFPCAEQNSELQAINFIDNV